MWVVHLQEFGATVEVTEDADRVSFRRGRGVPDEAASCHTAIVEGYTIEGHVPAEAIARLVADRPAVAGLALPGMPSDSPGMGGDPTSWARQAVLTIATDGSLAPFVF